MEKSGSEKPERAKARRVSRKLTLVIVTVVVLVVVGLSFEKLTRIVPLLPEIVRLEYEILRDPQNSDHEWLARLYDSAGMYGMAQYHYSKADSIQNASYDVKLHLAQTLFRDCKYSEAIEKYEEAIPLAQNDFFKMMCWGNISACYVQLKDYDKAIEAANEVQKFSPDGTDGLGQLGFLYSKKGEYDKAIPYFTELIEKKGEDDAVCYMLAEAYDKQAEYDKALEFYEKSLKLYSKRGMPPKKDIEKRIKELKALKSTE